MAVKLGYKNVYRDPMGYPQWKAAGHPVVRPAGGSATTATAPVTTPSDASAAPNLKGWGLLITLAGIFLGGMALNLTPCVYPLIPVTVSYFGSRSGQSRRQLVAHGACYVGGLAVTNSVLGVVAALTGGLMGALLQNPVVLILVALVLTAFATSLFGAWELRMPSGLTQAASKSYTGYFGTVFMGITLGVVAAPCIGPFVLGLLTWVASIGSPYLGFLVFFTLSIGLGLPLFILGLFSGQMGKLPRSGQWMVWVRKLMGWVLIGMAVYFIRPLLPKIGAVWLFGITALAAGLHLGWIDRTTAGFKSFAWLKLGSGLAGVVLATVFIGAYLFQGAGVDWQSYSEDLLQQARDDKRPVIIDFSATWCAPCRELDDVTFHDPAVVKQVRDAFVMIKVDLTRKGDAMNEALVTQYQVKGVPTVVFIDGNGNERSDLRLVDFLPADQFIARMKAVGEG